MTDHPVLQALAILLPQCDGAFRLDGCGLNKIDAQAMSEYGVRDPDAWGKRLAKYARQIGQQLADECRSAGERFALERDTKPFVIYPGSGDLYGVDIVFQRSQDAKVRAEVACGRRVLIWNSDELPRQWAVHKNHAAKLVASGCFQLSPAVDPVSVPNAAPQRPPPALSGKTHKDANIPQLFGYQCEGVDHIIRALETRGAMLLADDMGLGKTLQALAAIKALGKKAFVVCPASARFVWVGEVLKFTDMTVSVFKDPCSKKRRKALYGAEAHRVIDSTRNADVAVCSYEGTRQVVVDNNDPETRGFATMKKMVHPRLREWFRERVVIADEAQLAKNRKALRTQATLACLRAAGYAMALTGTPVMNRAEELWTLLCGLGVNCDVASTRKEFYERFVEGGDTMALNAKLRAAPWWLRRMKIDVEKDLPKKVRCDLIIPMSKSGSQRYARERARIGSGACILGIMANLQTIANEEKINTMLEILKERTDAGHSSVVQCTRTEPLFKLNALLQRNGVAACTITGQDNDSERAYKCAEFQAGRASVALTTIDTAITLTAADTVFLLDVDWSPTKITQREDRIHRIGQKNEAVFVVRVISASIDRHKVNVVAAKQEIISEIVDGGEHPWREDALMGEVANLLALENEEEQNAN